MPDLDQATGEPHAAGGAAVWVRALGVDPGPFGRALDEVGVRQVDGAGLGVVLVDGYLHDQLARINAEALRDARPWLLVRPGGRQGWLGPLFRPGVTGCWECLALRLRANLPVGSYLAARTGRPASAAVDAAGSPATLQIAYGLAAGAVAAWAGLGTGPGLELEGVVRTFDVVSWKAESHALVRLPYCPACGAAQGPEENAFRPVVLAGRRKVSTSDGGHRVVAPEVTLARYGHHVSPITGAVSMLERVGPAGEGGVHVYIAGHNFARRHQSLDHLRGDLRNMSAGKGASDVQARASGLCEGLERYSGVFRGDEPRRTATASRLGGTAVALADCLLFSERQYRERDAWNARGSHFNYVPAPLDPAAEIEWTPVWSLTRREVRYLPTAFCYYNYPFAGGEPFCLADSNGNAAGNSLAEAVLQGFFELVERDAVALWWYNRVSRPGVDLGAFGDSYLSRLGDHLRDRGRELWALDLTSDLGVPVFVALSRETSGAGPGERIVLGFGAHLDARVALRRAVTEMNQMMANLPDGSTRKGPAGHVSDPETLHWLRTATAANQPYLLPDPSAAPRGPSAFAGAWTDDVAEDVRACQGRVERLGLEVMVLDQTRPEVGLPVVKVIVPGLRHFWARLAPGRLYDVPVKLGWREEPLTEEDLNPIPMFL